MVVGIGLNWQSWQSWCLHVLQTLLLSPLAEKFLQNQRLSYGQLLFLLLGVENGTRTEPGVPLLQVQLLLEGEGMEITMSSSKSQPQRGKQAVTFRYPSWHFGEPHWGLGLSTWFVWAVPGGSAPLSVPLGDLTVLCPGSSQEPRCLTWLRLALSCLPHSLSNRLHEAEEGAEPLLSAFSFQRLLSNLTSLRLRVSPGPVRGGWLLKTSMGPNRGGTGDIQQHQALEDERDCRGCFWRDASSL